MCEFPKFPFQEKKKSNQREWLLQLYNEDPRCYWCKKETVMSPSPRPPGLNLPLHTATVDHLYSKLDIRRPLVPYKEATVLSCLGCNKLRNIEEQAPFLKYSKEEKKFSLVRMLNNK